MDIGHSSTCAGNVTSWNFCYYTSAIQASGDYKLGIGIYSRNESTDAVEYSAVEGSYRNISVYLQMSMRNMPRPVIVCRNESISPVSVQRGDMFGIIVSDDENFIPVLAAGTEGSELLDLSTNDTLDTALHLYAIVVKDTPPGATPPPGSIAAIVIVVGLAVVGVVVGVVLVGVFYWRRKGYKTIVKNESGQFGASSSVKIQNSTPAMGKYSGTLQKKGHDNKNSKMDPGPNIHSPIDTIPIYKDKNGWSQSVL